jgi:hypothetical protein
MKKIEEVIQMSACQTNTVSFKTYFSRRNVVRITPEGHAIETPFKNSNGI